MLRMNRVMAPQRPRASLLFNLMRYISVENTPNPSCNKYYPGKPVMGTSETMDISDSKFASVSPLAEQLFEVDGVRRVFYGKDFISVSKVDEVQWDDIQNDVISKIEKFYEEEKPLFSGELAEGTESQKHVSQEVLDDDSEAVAMIKEILASRVRPFVQEDGGDVAFINFDEESGVVTLLVRILIFNNCYNNLKYLKIMVL